MLRALNKDGNKLDVEYDGKVPLYDKPAKKVAKAKNDESKTETPKGEEK